MSATRRLYKVVSKKCQLVLSFAYSDFFSELAFRNFLISILVLTLSLCSVYVLYYSPVEWQDVGFKRERKID